MKQYVRMAVPRGLVVGTAAAIALAWGLFALNTDAWPGLVGAIAQTALFLANLVLTARSRRVKVLIVRTLQRWTINPLVRLLLGIGINPLGLAILETRGRVSGQPRRTPVGNGRMGNTFWIIAEHGARAGYVLGDDPERVQHSARPAGARAAAHGLAVPVGTGHCRSPARRRRTRSPTPPHPLAPAAGLQRDERPRARY
jgi:hypothetical protein